MVRQGPRRSASAVLSILFLLAISLVTSSTAAGQGTVDLVGAIVTDTGASIGSAAMIVLETESGDLAAQTPTNSDGRFELAGLRKIHYRLTVTAEGYETWQQDLDLTFGAAPSTIKISLTPLRKTKVNPALAPALSDNQAPKNARRAYEKGAHALAARKLEEARLHLEKAVTESPCYARAQTDLAVVLTQQRQLPGAEAALRQAIQCDPGFPDAYSQLGQLLNSEKKFAESTEVLQDAIRRSPGFWQFYYQLAIAHFGLKQYKQAEEEYLKVQSLDRNPPTELHVKLADVYLKENSYDKAYAEMLAYLRAEPEGRFAAKIKTIMQQMESSGALHVPVTGTSQPPPG